MNIAPRRRALRGAKDRTARFGSHGPRLRLLVVLWLAISLQACERVALDERFHNKELTGWTAVDDPDTLEGPSLWRVEKDGWLHQRSNIWGRRGDFLGRWYGTYLITGDPVWRDYLVSIKARPGDNDGFGLVFRWMDGQHFYRLLFIEDEMNGGPVTRLDKRIGDDYTEIWSLKDGFRAGSEMVIELETSGETIKGRLNGRALFEAMDTTYGMGKVGLFCYAQSDQAFDDVKVIMK